MTFAFEQPPAELTWYHLGPLLDADAGTLKYDKDRYRISGVSNNATACIWCGLLTPNDDGLVLTDLGQQKLTDWKNSPAGQKWLASWSALDSTASPDDAAPTPQTPPARGAQLDLFEQPTT